MKLELNLVFWAWMSDVLSPWRSCRTRSCSDPGGLPLEAPPPQPSCPASCRRSSASRAVWAPATRWWVLPWTAAFSTHGRAHARTHALTHSSGHPANTEGHSGGPTIQQGETQLLRPLQGPDALASLTGSVFAFLLAKASFFLFLKHTNSNSPGASVAQLM